MKKSLLFFAPMALMGMMLAGCITPKKGSSSSSAKTSSNSQTSQTSGSAGSSTAGSSQGGSSEGTSSEAGSSGAVGTKTFTVDTALWDEAPAASYYAYAWGGAYGEGEGMGAFIAVSAGSFTVNTDATGMILLRLDPSKTAGWDAEWNRTEDITPVDYTKSGIRITAWGEGFGAKCTWAWID